MDFRHSACTDTTQGLVTSTGQMDADGFTKAPEFVVEKVEDVINDRGSEGSYPADPAVRVAKRTKQRCSGGRTLGPAKPSSTQTWWGSSWGWPGACAPARCAFAPCCSGWRSGGRTGRAPGFLGVVVWCELEGLFRNHRFSRRKGISVSFLKTIAF